MAHMSPFHRLPNSTVIDFDDVPDSTVIDTHYANRGVTFAAITTNPPSQSHAYARQAVTAKTQPNGVSLVPYPYAPFFDARAGGIQATFTVPQIYVSIFAQAILLPENISPATNKPFMEAFDQQDNLLQTVFYGPNWGEPTYGSWQALTIQSTSANIDHVVFSSQHHDDVDVFALFDHLVFTPQLLRIALGGQGHPILRPA